MRWFLAAGLFCCVGVAQQPSQMELEGQLWNSIKAQLTGPDADTYFNTSLKDAQLPALRGTLVEHKPFDVVLDVAMSDARQPDVSILLSQDAAKHVNKLPSSAVIQFEGVAIGFSKTPFNLAFEVEDAQPPVASLGAMASTWYLGPKRQGPTRAIPN